MDKKRVLALVAATLVVGLVLGNMVSAWAAGPSAAATGTTSANGIVAGACGLGLRMGAAVRDAGGRMIDIVAELTGLSTTDIAAKRAEGQSLEQIAESKGVSSEEVVDEALAVRKQLLDAKVKDGTITQAQADQALANIESRLTDRVQSTAPCGGGSGGRMGGGRGMGGRGMGGGGCGGTCGQTPAATTLQ